MKDIEVTVTADGVIQLLHTDELDLGSLGRLNVRRASHVEFDNAAQVWVARTPTGELLGEFRTRREALDYKVQVLNERISAGTIEGVFCSMSEEG